MSLGIEINGEALVLPPGAVMELEQENPLLQFSEEVRGDFSIPIEIDADPKNVRLTNYNAIPQTRVDVTGIDAVVYDGGEQHSIGKIKFEKGNHNLNNLKAGSLSFYYLTGIASFYKDIENIKLKDVPMGGNRNFPWTGFARTGSNGFWQHIHAVIDAAPGSYDYAFYPVINKGWEYGPYDKTEVMNYMGYSGGTVNFDQHTTDGLGYNVITPFPYLKYVIDRIADHIGWKIEGEILSDPEFLKATMLSFKAINWTNSTLFTGVNFDLKDHMPDITVSKFLIWLKNRMGWGMEPDRRSKILRIKPISVTSIGEVKDFTSYASPLLPKRIAQKKKAYALRNDFSGTPSQEAVNLTGVNYQGSIDSVILLPAAAEAYANFCYLVTEENNYYSCQADPDTGTWRWDIFSYNIYDFVQEGEVEDITTGATAVGSEKYSAYLDFIPRMDVKGEWTGLTSRESNWSKMADTEEATFGIHLLFYYGMRNNKSGQPVPYANSGIYDSAGVLVGTWSLCFKAQKKDGTEVGLYDLQWKKFLGTLQSREEFDVTLYLPRHEFLKLKFYDVISIQNIWMYVKKIKSKIPYNNVVQVESIRI